MNLINTRTNREKRLKRLRIAMLGIGFALVASVALLANELYQNSTKNGSNSESGAEQEPSDVTIVRVGEAKARDTVKAAGVVLPKTKIDVAALGSGTVRDILVEVGDLVSQNELIASLSDSATITNFETNRINYENLSQSLGATRGLADESVRLAEISVQRAEESVASAEIALQTAQSNYQTTLPLHVQQTKKAIQDAMAAYHTNLQSVQTALDDSNYIIRAQGVRQRENISPTLSINDPASLIRARGNWNIADSAYGDQILKTIGEDTVHERLDELIRVLEKILTTANDAVAVLQYTTQNTLFSQEELEEERADMVALKTSIANNKALVVNTRDSLATLATTQNKELSSLQNAVKASKNQLNLAAIAADTARSQLASAGRSREGQLLGAQTTLDSARGARNLASQAIADLSVTAPIRGTVTARYVETGTKVNPGSPIVQISQTDLVTIEAGLSQEQANRVRVGDVAIIEKTHAGVVNRIDPVADPFSRKVKVEIVFDNAKRDLVPETFVNVEIPLAGDEAADGSFLAPLAALTITQTEQYVFIVEDGKAKKTPVETGAVLDRQIEITSGLAFGDSLIVDGSKQVKDGEVVHVRE